MDPIPLESTQAALDQLGLVLDQAIAFSAGRDIDSQQVAVARLADLATQLRAAQDLSAYASGAGAPFPEQAAVFAGGLASQIASLVSDHGPEHGLEDLTLPEELVRFTRTALCVGRIAAIGRETAKTGGSNDGPVDEMLTLTREAAREFASNEIAPHAERIHRQDETIPEEFLTKMGELGYFGLSVPEQYGGVEMGNQAMVITTEELSRASLAAAGSLITRPEILAKALLAGGTERQKQEWLPRIASGELMVGIAVTEPDIGSDVASVKCRAETATARTTLPGAVLRARSAGRRR